jgi:transcriptional regulatory protein RtcR
VAASADTDLVARFLPADRIAQLDRFDRTQLADALAACLDARSLSEAGRMLFSASRARRTTANDADRLRKYLARFGLAWQDLHAARRRAGRAGRGRLSGALGADRWIARHPGRRRPSGV